MRLIIGDSYDEMSETAAEDFIFNLEQFKRPLICLPSGNTPVGFYKKLVEYFLKQDAYPDWYFIGLDEWVGVGANEKGSCRQFLDKHFFIPLNIDPARISFFNGLAEDLQAECETADKHIRSFGGIDIAVLGLGRNGHLGFNEPGTDVSMGAHVVDLHETTQQAGVHYFGEPRELKKGITLGMKSLLSSGSVLLLVNGIHKAEVVKRMVEEPATYLLPASLLQNHPKCFVYLDRMAAELV